jgi:hypothetical protein
MADFPSVLPAPYEQDPTYTDRVDKQGILPGSVQPRHLASDFISWQPASTYYTVTLAANTYITLYWHAQTTNLAPLLVSFDAVAFQDVIDTNHQIWSGTSVNPNNWQVDGPKLNAAFSTATSKWVSYAFFNKDTVAHTIYAKVNFQYVSVQNAGTVVTV